jgi:hypothetical protein
VGLQRHGDFLKLSPNLGHCVDRDAPSGPGKAGISPQKGHGSPGLGSRQRVSGGAVEKDHLPSRLVTTTGSGNSARADPGTHRHSGAPSTPAALRVGSEERHSLISWPVPSQWHSARVFRKGASYAPTNQRN